MASPTNLITQPTGGTVTACNVLRTQISEHQFNKAKPQPSTGHWQLATDSAFTDVIQEINSPRHVRSWIVGDLEPDRTYYLRMRFGYRHIPFGRWSNTVRFKTDHLLEFTSPQLQLEYQQSRHAEARRISGGDFTADPRGGLPPEILELLQGQGIHPTPPQSPIESDASELIVPTEILEPSSEPVIGRAVTGRGFMKTGFHVDESMYQSIADDPVESRMPVIESILESLPSTFPRPVFTIPNDEILSIEGLTHYMPKAVTPVDLETNPLSLSEADDRVYRSYIEGECVTEPDVPTVTDPVPIEGGSESENGQTPDSRRIPHRPSKLGDFF